MDEYLRNLILSYDRAADERDKFATSDWKKDLRQDFLSTLKSEGKITLIDIGAGTGIHGKFFKEEGMDVTCVDLSPANIEICNKKGLNSYVLNVVDLESIGQSYDSAFALNSLLHIPTNLLPDVLRHISGVLESAGLLFWGQYGGEQREGVYEDDTHEPKRFFSLLNDDQMAEMASRNFNIERLDKIQLENLFPLYFQSMLLRVKTDL